MRRPWVTHDRMYGTSPSGSPMRHPRRYSSNDSKMLVVLAATVLVLVVVVVVVVAVVVAVVAVVVVVGVAAVVVIVVVTVVVAVRLYTVRFSATGRRDWARLFQEHRARGILIY